MSTGRAWANPLLQGIGGCSAPDQPPALSNPYLSPPSPPYLPGMVSLWSLAVVAFERFLVICKPLGNFTFRGSHAAVGCALTWAIGLAAATPPLFGWSR